MLGSKLTVQQFAELPKKLDLKGVWFNRTVNNPQDMNQETLRQFAKILSIHAYTLLTDYGCAAQNINALDCLALEAHCEKQMAKEKQPA